MRFFRHLGLRAGAALAVFGCATVASVCSVYDPSLLVVPGDAAPPPDVANEAGSGDADTCPHYRWPPRPTTDDGPGNGTYTLAMSNLGFELPADAGVPIGYDLDFACTCPGPPSCKPPADAAQQCDDDGGIDNAGGKLLDKFTQFSDLFNPAMFRQQMKNGVYTFVFRLKDYNGGANDSQVSFAVYSSKGTKGVEKEAGVPTPAAFDGNDVWTVDPGSLIGGQEIVGQDCGSSSSTCVPLYVDPRAYVTDHVLVAAVDFPFELVNFAGSGLKIDFVGSVVVATLHLDGAGVRIDNGKLTGRWRTGMFLTALATLDDPYDGGKLCGSNATYQTFKSLACGVADVSGDLKQDNTGAPCDAISVAFSFTASAAKLGAVYARPPVASQCGATYSDTCP